MTSDEVVMEPAPGDLGCPRGAATAVISPEGIVTGWSEEAGRLLGHQAREVVGRAAVELVAATEASDAAGFTPAGSSEWSGTATLRHRDGHRVDVRLRAYPSLAGDGTLQGYLLTAVPYAPESQDEPPMMDRAFTQASIAMSVFDTASGRWRLNTAAAGAAPAAGGEGADEPFLRHIHQVAEQGKPARFETHTPARSVSREQARIVELWPVRDPVSGQVCGVGTATFDSSQHHRARQRLALLNEAGTRIGTALKVVRTAQELADAAVPRLADFASVDLLDSVLQGEEPVPGPIGADVKLRRVAHRSSTSGTPEAAVPLGELDTYPAFTPPARCLATGRPVLTGKDDPDFLRWMALHEARSARVREYGFHSIMAAPLRARGVTLGVAIFAKTQDSEPFEQDDLILAGEFADRAAVGVDNARRYIRERSATLTMQRSLLPRRLPAQAAVQAAFRYLPAGSRAGAGGDWFDVVPLSGTRVALVVGDVVGHGIRASATMGRLRTAVRTLADVDLPPDELLTHLDDLVRHLDSDDGTGDQGTVSGTDAEELGATCLYAIYDPVTRICTIASAGHPPPVALLPDGTVEVVQLSPGPLLGIGGLPFEATEVELPEGSLLAFYTDGLIEGRDHDVGAGLDRLCRTLADQSAPSLEVSCDAMLRALLPPTPADDVALLLARTRALHADQVATWAVPASPSIVADARAQVGRQLAAWKLEEATPVTELVVSELVTNAIRYGAVPIGLRLIRDRTLICEVSDASSTAPHLRRARVYDEGGRGLDMVAQLTQSWGSRQTPTGKTIWAEQALPVG
ncbi:SpoIIE family protein phosphatase [Streptomyces sp. HD1123-B1]|uniref:ATP-binding SpoIIE family protein phosphatase n=1 Tax=Streptomyces huangiella TaxID=3228804 RepID=UPI003D7D127D